MTARPYQSTGLIEVATHAIEAAREEATKLRAVLGRTDRRGHDRRTDEATSAACLQKATPILGDTGHRVEAA